MIEKTLGGLEEHTVESWADIHTALDGFGSGTEPVPPGGLTQDLADGVAFLTFDYGIDGVTIEIAKYASCLEQELGDRGDPPVIHCIGGDFHPSADQVLTDRWRRKRIEQANGWSKWCGGVWFDRMFRADMPSGSPASAEVAGEVWRQALGFARELEGYIRESGIGLLVVVNVNSNPGNPALALAAILASEVLELPVINSCHDFFWESGKPASEREPDEAPGPRDHFFRNSDNEDFFRFLARINPWNGSRWLTLVINAVQREELIRRTHIAPTRLIEIGTFIENEFFVPITPARKTELRRHLGYILAHGERVVPVELVEDFERRIPSWMRNQLPIVCGQGAGSSFDLADPNAIWFLQPTRIVPRKRIPRDWDLIEALLFYAPFRLMFEETPELTLTLHVSGPVPAEHEADLRDVISSFRRVLNGLPDYLANRVFLALSAGKLGYSTFQGRGHDHLSIADLYHLADLVLLPSFTEGRGLPILEASATGLPLVCTRYHPREVFNAVVGTDLEDRQRLKYAPFPDGHIDTGLLQEITDRVFLPMYASEHRLHNRRAVAERYGMRELTSSFATIIDMILGSDDGPPQGG